METATKKTEAQITASIRKFLSRNGIYNVKIAGGGMQEAGLPDLLAVVGGHLFAFEIKVPGAKARPLQDHQLTRINNAGGTALVVSDVSEVAAALELHQGHCETVLALQRASWR